DDGSALQESMAASARTAGESIRPAIEAAMAQIVQEAQRTQQRLGEVVGTQVDALGGKFEQGSATLLAGVEDALGRMQAQQARADAQAREASAQALQSLGDSLQAQWRTLGAEASAQQQAVCRSLAEAAGQIDRLAGTWRAEMAALRQEESRAAERGNAALQERAALLERLAALLDTVEAASAGQRQAIHAMVASASSALEQASGRFAEALAAQEGRAAEMAAHITAGAVELSSVAEAFAQGVQLFQGSSDKLSETLQGVEASLARSTARSDEQLAYYVAQAREVIDLSIASQHGVLEQLRQLQAKPAKPLALADKAAA
ncbi:MAG TPA: hypothetical protein VGD76_04205, partial [Ramlibacter sp.]